MLPIRFKNPKVWSDTSQEKSFYLQILSLFVLVIKAFLAERSVASYFRHPLPTVSWNCCCPFYTRTWDSSVSKGSINQWDASVGVCRSGFQPIKWLFRWRDASIVAWTNEIASLDMTFVDVQRRQAFCLRCCNLALRTMKTEKTTEEGKSLFLLLLLPDTTSRVHLEHSGNF